MTEGTFLEAKIRMKRGPQCGVHNTKAHQLGSDCFDIYIDVALVKRYRNPQSRVFFEQLQQQEQTQAVPVRAVHGNLRVTKADR